MSLRKSKIWYSNNCLHFSKCAVPLKHLSTLILISPLEWTAECIDLERITRCNLGIVRVGHFWKCYGSEASKSYISRSFEALEIIAFYPFKEKLRMITV